ncbi:glycoside hydrolase family 15 protein [Haladaptatus salinisoli]|uniref:glycoside hydrolase family 15 protein n=1 Tax=Haladaptatus salinisoli TaxID=2884876 RepID=UPI001D0A5394|nr:glycoside hydrolase family 15 protein [Haladaptatus salinisoli]
MTNNYPPIESYGIVGNLETCALVDPTGAIAWYPLPHIESPSVFAAILDADQGGHFRISLLGAYETEQRYLPQTNVLQTEFRTDDGTVQITDFMPPTEAGMQEPCRALYRKIKCTDGTVDLEVDFTPRHDYGLADMEVSSNDGNITAKGGNQQLTLSSDIDLQTETDSMNAAATTQLEADESRWLVLAHGDGSPPDATGCDQALERTISYWREWTHNSDEAPLFSSDFDSSWQEIVIRSALVLKLLTHTETGAIAAAPTTSLPEEIGGVRNWDYRYSWPRDAAFTVQALTQMGYLQEADAYFEWFLELCRMPPGEIQPLYGLHGEVDLEERELDHLEGYQGSSPVRTGNAAADQRQIDVYGELVLAVSVAVHHGWELGENDWRAYSNIVDYVIQIWEQPDSGIWEVRSQPRHFVHSKVMCWTALDRAIALAEQSEWDAPLDRWRDSRERIRTTILDRGFNEERNTFTRAFDGEELDATALLIPMVGFLPFNDERIQGTITAIRQELETDEGFVRRYNGEDGLPGDEGTFVLCSFWLVDTLALSGQIEEACERFQSLLEYVSPLGLLAEEIDLADDASTHRGNFPQAFSHIGVINSALYLNWLSDSETTAPEPVGIWLGEGVAIPD